MIGLRLLLTRTAAKIGVSRWLRAAGAVQRGHPRIGFVFALLLAVTAGCARYHPRPVDLPKLERDYKARSLRDDGFLAFVAANSSGRESAVAGRVDLRLLTLAAFYYSPEIDVARARLEAAEAAILTARARPNPQISLDGLLSSYLLLPYLFSFENGFALETAGKRGYRILAATKASESARVALAEAAWRARDRVRNAYTEHLLAKREAELLAAERALRAETVQILEARLAAGEASRPEVDLTATELIRVSVSLEAAQGREAATLPALASAAGLPAAAIRDAPLSPRDLAALPGTLPLERAGSAGIRGRLDLQRELIEHAAADARLRLEIARQSPNLLFSPAYTIEEFQQRFRISPVVELPIFDRRRGPVAEAEARRKEAEARLAATQAQAIGELEIALARYRSGLAELAEARQRLTVIQERRERAVERAFAAGEEDRLALTGVRVQRAVSAYAEWTALRRAISALAALEDAVQQPLGPDAAPVAIPPARSPREVQR